MSYSRSPIYIISICDGTVICNDHYNDKSKLHPNNKTCNAWECKPKNGERSDEIAYRHMAEHYRHLCVNPETFDDAELIRFNALMSYLWNKPLIGWFIRKIILNFDEKYGFEEGEIDD